MTLRLGTVHVLLGGNRSQWTPTHHMLSTIIHKGFQTPPTIQGICLRFLSTLDALMLPLCGLNFFSDTPPTCCDLFLACFCFCTLLNPLHCHVLKISPTDRNTVMCSMENLLQDSGGSKKSFNIHGNSANIHCKNEYFNPESSSTVAAPSRNVKIFSSFNE